MLQRNYKISRDANSGMIYLGTISSRAHFISFVMAIRARAQKYTPFQEKMWRSTPFQCTFHNLFLSPNYIYIYLFVYFVNIFVRTYLSLRFDNILNSWTYRLCTIFCTAACYVWKVNESSPYSALWCTWTRTRCVRSRESNSAITRNIPRPWTARRVDWMRNSETWGSEVSASAGMLRGVHSYQPFSRVFRRSVHLHSKSRWADE